MHGERDGLRRKHRDKKGFDYHNISTAAGQTDGLADLVVATLQVHHRATQVIDPRQQLLALLSLEGGIDSVHDGVAAVCSPGRVGSKRNGVENLRHLHTQERVSLQQQRQVKHYIKFLNLTA